MSEPMPKDELPEPDYEAAENQARATLLHTPGELDHDNLARAYLFLRAELDQCVACLNDRNAERAMSRTAAPEGLRERLFVAIEHGDEKHRQWLKDKLTEFFASEAALAPAPGEGE